MDRRTGNPRGLTPDGQKIRELREDRGITAAELAKATGRSTDFIYKIEQRSWRISKVTATRIANTLSVSRDKILAGNDAGTGSDAETKIPA
jgi:transcriptional regulator with XRE-family HTH domain